MSFSKLVNVSGQLFFEIKDVSHHFWACAAAFVSETFKQFENRITLFKVSFVLSAT